MTNYKTNKQIINEINCEANNSVLNKQINPIKIVHSTKLEKFEKCLKKIKIKSIVVLDSIPPKDEPKQIPIANMSFNIHNRNIAHVFCMGKTPPKPIKTSPRQYDHSLKPSSINSRSSVVSFNWIERKRNSLFYRRLDSYPKVNGEGHEGFYPFVGYVTFDNIDERPDLNYIVKIDYACPEESVIIARKAFSIPEDKSLSKPQSPFSQKKKPLLKPLTDKPDLNTKRIILPPEFIKNDDPPNKDLQKLTKEEPIQKVRLDPPIRPIRRSVPNSISLKGPKTDAFPICEPEPVKQTMKAASSEKCKRQDKLVEMQCKMPESELLQKTKTPKNVQENEVCLPKVESLKIQPLDSTLSKQPATIDTEALSFKLDQNGMAEHAAGPDALVFKYSAIMRLGKSKQDKNVKTFSDHEESSLKISKLEADTKTLSFTSTVKPSTEKLLSYKRLKSTLDTDARTVPKSISLKGPKTDANPICDPPSFKIIKFGNKPDSVLDIIQYRKIKSDEHTKVCELIKYKTGKEEPCEKEVGYGKEMFFVINSPYLSKSDSQSNSMNFIPRKSVNLKIKKETLSPNVAIQKDNIPKIQIQKFHSRKMQPTDFEKKATTNDAIIVQKSRSRLPFLDQAKEKETNDKKLGKKTEIDVIHKSSPMCTRKSKVFEIPRSDSLDVTPVHATSLFETFIKAKAASPLQSGQATATLTHSSKYQELKQMLFKMSSGKLHMNEDGPKKCRDATKIDELFDFFSQPKLFGKSRKLVDNKEDDDDEGKELKKIKEIKDTKEINEEKEMKDAKEIKEAKETKEAEIEAEKKAKADSNFPYVVQDTCAIPKASSRLFRQPSNPALDYQDPPSDRLRIAFTASRKLSKTTQQFVKQEVINPPERNRSPTKDSLNYATNIVPANLCVPKPLAEGEDNDNDPKIEPIVIPNQDLKQVLKKSPVKAAINLEEHPLVQKVVHETGPVCKNISKQSVAPSVQTESLAAEKKTDNETKAQRTLSKPLRDVPKSIEGIDAQTIKRITSGKTKSPSAPIKGDSSKKLRIKSQGIEEGPFLPKIATKQLRMVDNVSGSLKSSSKSAETPLKHGKSPSRIQLPFNSESKALRSEWQGTDIISQPPSDVYGAVAKVESKINKNPSRIQHSVHPESKALRSEWQGTDIISRPPSNVYEFVPKVESEIKKISSKIQLPVNPESKPLRSELHGTDNISQPPSNVYDVVLKLESKNKLHNPQKTKVDIAVRKSSKIMPVPSRRFKVPSKVTLRNSNQKFEFQKLSSPSKPSAERSKSHSSSNRAVNEYRNPGENEDASNKEQHFENPTKVPDIAPGFPTNLEEPRSLKVMNYDTTKTLKSKVIPKSNEALKPVFSQISKDKRFKSSSMREHLTGEVSPALVRQEYPKTPNSTGSTLRQKLHCQESMDENKTYPGSDARLVIITPEESKKEHGDAALVLKMKSNVDYKSPQNSKCPQEFAVDFSQFGTTNSSFQKQNDEESMREPSNLSTVPDKVFSNKKTLGNANILGEHHTKLEDDHKLKGSSDFRETEKLNLPEIEPKIGSSKVTLVVETAKIEQYDVAMLAKMDLEAVKKNEEKKERDSSEKIQISPKDGPEKIRPKSKEDKEQNISQNLASSPKSLKESYGKSSKISLRVKMQPSTESKQKMLKVSSFEKNQEDGIKMPLKAKSTASDEQKVDIQKGTQKTENSGNRIKLKQSSKIGDRKSVDEKHSKSPPGKTVAANKSKSKSKSTNKNKGLMVDLSGGENIIVHKSRRERKPHKPPKEGKVEEMFYFQSMIIGEKVKSRRKKAVKRN